MMAVGRVSIVEQKDGLWFVVDVIVWLSIARLLKGGQTCALTEQLRTK